MSLQYISNVKDNNNKEEETEQAIPPVAPSTDSQAPQEEPTPVVEKPIEEPTPSTKVQATPEEDKQHLKRTTPMPTVTESTALNNAIDTLNAHLNINKEPSEADLKYQEKQRKAELLNSYTWMAVKIAAAICFVALAVSYLRMAKTAQFKALNY